MRVTSIKIGFLSIDHKCSTFLKHNYFLFVIAFTFNPSAMAIKYLQGTVWCHEIEDAATLDSK
jgi:hypothetical protein